MITDEGMNNMNSIIEVAKTKREEKYITPEDVVDALNKGRRCS